MVVVVVVVVAGHERARLLLKLAPRPAPFSLSSISRHRLFFLFFSLSFFPLLIYHLAFFIALLSIAH